MDEAMRALLGKRKNRTLAIMLSEKEEIADDYLPEDVSQELRKMILDYVNEFHDFCVDLVESSEAGMVFNELAMQKLVSIEAAVGGMNRRA
jgi:hypothetical protein